MAELTPKQKADRDRFARVVCREAERGKPSCYQCKDAATRLVLAGLSIQSTP